MDQAQMHQEVATVGPNGTVTFAPLLFWGHANATTMGHFIELAVRPAESDDGSIPGETRTLHLTQGHFVPVVKPPRGGARASTSPPRFEDHLELRAGQVNVGDTLWVVSSEEAGGAVVPATVFRKRTDVELPGLFNPYSAAGLVVVNDVVASEHSDSFLDALWPGKWDHHLPMAYHVCLAPFRWLSQSLPTEWAVSTQRHLDWLANWINQ